MQLRSSTVLIISYHFYPSTEIGARRVTALARHLATLGIRVIVVSAFGNEVIVAGSEILPGITAIPIRRSERTFTSWVLGLRRHPNDRSRMHESQTSAAQPTTPSLANRTYFRIAHFVDQYKKWAWNASNAAVAAGRRYGATLVMASGPPHSALLAGAVAARRLDIPYVADLRDPWSDQVAGDDSTREDAPGLLRVLERWVVRGAAAVTSTGSTVAAVLSNRYTKTRNKIHVIRNGYDGRTVPVQRQTGGRLAILFAGELYVGRDPFPFLGALEALLARPEVDSSRIRVMFMGKVESYAGQPLSSWLQGRRAARVVTILPPQTAEVVRMATVDATLLLNLAQGQRLSVPAKTYEHLACGREILILCEPDCETAKMMSGIQGVSQVDPRDSQALGRVMLDLYNRHVVLGGLEAPTEIQISKFSRESANRGFQDLFAQIEGRNHLGSSK
jgi:hypothetical protein